MRTFIIATILLVIFANNVIGIDESLETCEDDSTEETSTPDKSIQDMRSEESEKNDNEHHLRRKDILRNQLLRRAYERNPKRIEKYLEIKKLIDENRKIRDLRREQIKKLVDQKHRRRSHGRWE